MLPTALIFWLQLNLKKAIVSVKGEVSYDVLLPKNIETVKIQPGV